MANIELVIKISDGLYNNLDTIKNGSIASKIILDCVRNGTPLPKGHGRLFDERDIVNGNYEIIGNKIYEVEPIIEADKAKSE